MHQKNRAIILPTYHPVPAWKDSYLACPIPGISGGLGIPTQPGASLAHPKWQEAKVGLLNKFRWWQWGWQGPAPRLKPTQVCQLVLVRHSPGGQG